MRKTHTSIREKFVELVNGLDTIGYQMDVLSKKLDQQNKLLALVGEAICVKVTSDCERKGQDWIEADAKDVRRRLRKILRG